MICSLQKVGSNSMHNFLRSIMAEHYKNENELKNPLSIEEGYNIVELPVNSQCWPKCAENYTKVILVRHPLERLLSAYLYIFKNSDGKYYNNYYTWEEFVQHIIQYPENDSNWKEIQENVGNHWEPYWRVCQVCDRYLKPNFILKLENIEKDLRQYLTEVGLEKYAADFPWSNPTKGMSFCFKAGGCKTLQEFGSV